MEQMKPDCSNDSYRVAPRFSVSNIRSAALLATRPGSTFPEGALLRDWIQSNSHVFFDFSEESLYWLLPGSNDYWALIIQLSRQAFIELHSPDSRDRFDEEAKRYGVVAPKISSPATEAVKRAPKDPLDTLLTLHKARYRNRP